MRPTRAFIRLALCAVAGLSAVPCINAGAQALSTRLAPSMPGIDSLVAAEFAKDSTGSITVGVIAGSDLIWTRSYGFADVAND